MNDSIDLGGSGGQAFSFGAVGTQPGAYVVGKVLALAEVQARVFEGPRAGQPATWDNGDPKMQYRVTLQTDLRDPANTTDTGVRDVYIDGRRTAYDNGSKSKLCAVLDAVRAITGGTALAVGGYLRLQWVSGMGFAGDPRCFEAQYQAPTVELAPVVSTATGQPVVHQQPVPQAPPAQGFAQQQVHAYTQPQAPVQAPAADPWARQPAWPSQAQQTAQAPAQQPVTLGQAVHEVQQQLGAQPVQTEQGPVNPQTGQVLAPPPGITAEAVAAVKAGGMDPRAVWPGVDLSAFGV